MAIAVLRRVRTKAVVVGVRGRELTTVGRRILWTRLSKARAPYVAVLGAVAIIVAMAYTPGVTRLPGLVRGVVAGITATAVVGALAWYLFLSDASFSWRMGPLGEYWTSEELRTLGRGWTVLNSLRVPGANGVPVEVDHVAVGPGGVVVVQTKLRPSELRQIDASNSIMINTFALEAHRQAAVVRLFIGDLVDETSVLEIACPVGIGPGFPGRRGRDQPEGGADRSRP